MNTRLASFFRAAGIVTLASVAVVALPASAAGRVAARGAVANAQGGVTGGSIHAARGAHGGAVARGHAYQTDGQGNVTTSSRAVARGPNGGTAETSGSFSHSADGSNSGTRTTSATGANGNSYNGSTTLSNGQVTHSGTCTNASGAVIACPTR